MSYNTRRTGTGSGNTGRPTTQVNYHQQVPKAASQNAVNAAARGYTTTTNPQSYNSSAQPAYSTPQPQQPAYQTNPPLPKTPAPPQPPVAPSTPAPAPAMKQEPVTPQSATAATTENGEPNKPFWKKRVTKLSNKVKKQRQNAKLRRILNPKNALTFLNELKPGGIKYNMREDPGWGFTATVEIEGKTYTGHGMTVSKAKVQASESALRDMLLEKMAKAQAAAPAKEEKKEGEDESMEQPDESMETEDKEEGADGEGKGKKRPPPPEDDLPWGSLAAFALHKLLLEWQRDGIEMPSQEKFDEMSEEYYRRPGPGDFGGFPRRFGPPRGFPPGPPGGRFGPYPPRGPGPYMRPPAAGTPVAAPFGGTAPSPKPMKKIPDDPTQKHPVMLLNQMKPNVVYGETREGTAPNVVFYITIELDGKQYTGQGKNKKEAKKNAAKAALVPLGIVYPEGV